MLAAESSELPVAAGANSTLDPVANAARRRQSVVVTEAVQHDLVPESRPRAQELAESGVVVYAAARGSRALPAGLRGSHVDRRGTPACHGSRRESPGYVMQRDAQAGKVSGHPESDTPAA